MSRIFYFTDVHGHELTFHVLDWCFRQDPNCTIIFGGDAIDRGNYGYKIMLSLLQMPNVIYLLGNHEDMFIKAAHDVAHDNFKSTAVQLHCYNGGFKTLEDWCDEDCPMDVIERLQHLPLTYSYENIDFCHAGAKYVDFCQKTARPLLWNRDELVSDWAPNRYCVHGHTPICSHLGGRLTRPQLWLNKDKTGGRINMDGGTYSTNKIFVLDVETFMIYEFVHPNKEPITEFSILESQE